MNLIKIKYHLTDVAVKNGCKFEQPREGDAGYDICVSHDFSIPHRYAVLVPTGLHVEIPAGYVGIIKDRSGLSAKHDVYVHAGVIDSAYRGEVKVLMQNASMYSRGVKFQAGDRIAQMVIVPYLSTQTEALTLQELTKTVRGDGGFGSTGI